MQNLSDLKAIPQVPYNGSLGGMSLSSVNVENENPGDRDRFLGMPLDTGGDRVSGCKLKEG